ncbi:MAG: hypothetical protein HKN27_10810 [Silicimonas sp.]|nr:hypothetical protein [Silicimonas sp.]
MAQTARFATPDPERIDAIIDSVAANPEKASHAKSLLRATLKARAAVLPFPVNAPVANDDDDMWDNVPV